MIVYNYGNPNARLLFIAHRKEILQQSIHKFREVLNDFNFGDLFVDGNKPRQIEHLFMSIQSIDGTLHLRMRVSFFRGSFWNHTSNHIGGIAMAGRKEYRDLMVGDIDKNGKSVSKLRVSGLWLEELGFKTDDFVRIKCEDG